ncbi:hypothetical protein ACFLZ4_02550 [Patescibacteria group bacterium]
MDEFINIDKLISSAKRKGVNFGSGDPYNRLRYYTKIGWLPHMVRRAGKKGNIIGHYPNWALGRLINIETLKSRGNSNEEITKKLKLQNKIQGIRNAFSSPETRKQTAIYATLVVVALILASELGVIRLGKQKTNLVTSPESEAPKQILNSGVAFIPKNQTKVFVKSSEIKRSFKVYVTFIQNYSPATRFWVSQIRDGEGFLVELDAPVYENIEFNWWTSQ